jgi:hypothetical protein
MLGALEAIGCDTETTWQALARIAIDCVPAVRIRFIRELLTRDAPARTSDLAAAIGMTNRNAREHLEDLALLNLATRGKHSDAANSPDYWAASDLLHTLWPIADPRCTPQPPSPMEAAIKRSPQTANPLTPSPVHLGSTRIRLARTQLAPSGHAGSTGVSCAVCGQPLDPTLAAYGHTTHVTCEPSP